MLVAGAGTPIGLAIARGLAGRSARLIGAAVNLGMPTCRSRLWSGLLEVESPTEDAWLTTLRAAHERYGRMVLFAADDHMVRVIAENATDLAGMFDFVMPELSIVDRLLDKSVFNEWALTNGFTVPRTFTVSDQAELRAALGDLAFPVVFKPVEHTPGWVALSQHHKVHRFDSAADLDRLGFDPFDAAHRFVVQEWIPGRDSDVYFYLTYRDRGGAELATLGGRKISQWQVDIGNTALAITHQVAELRVLTRKLFDAAGHVGLGSLEVRRSSRDNRMVITEPTVGRPDLQTTLAAAAGVNLVEMAYLDAIGSPVPARRPRREAIWIHETGLPRSVIVAARRRRLDGSALRAALRVRRRPVGAILSLGDPLPFLVEMVRLTGKAARVGSDRTVRKVVHERLRRGPTARRRRAGRR